VTTFLAVECVSKRYGERAILSNATLHAVEGQVRALVGRNGTGKSTLLKIAAGWIQPDSGAIHVGGHAHLTVSLPMMARLGVFYLPDHDLLSPSFTVRAQLEMFRQRFHGGDIAEAAAVTGISDLLDRRPYSLSGGELRRAEIATALVRKPLCLLADEPYRGIAPIDCDVLTAAFRSLARGGCAVIMTGHEIHTVLDAVDHVTWCTDGTTYSLGPPAAALRDPRFQRDYMGPPAKKWVG